MPANYDSIASIYDLLSRIVFGKNIVKAQVCLLKYVPPNTHILIVGGGTGWILEELGTLYPAGLSIDYVELSAKMLALSKKRYYGDNMVHFINLPVENFTNSGLYDVILTPFMFDNFTADKAPLVFKRMDTMLKSNGLWLYADFVYNINEGRLWQRLLLKTMYLFFRITCGIETSELVDMEGHYNTGYRKIYGQAFYNEFIKATVYQKN